MVDARRRFERLQVYVLIDEARGIAGCIDDSRAVHDAVNVCVWPPRATRDQPLGKGAYVEPAPAGRATSTQSSCPIVKVVAIDIDPNAHGGTVSGIAPDSSLWNYDNTVANVANSLVTTKAGLNRPRGFMIGK